MMKSRSSNPTKSVNSDWSSPSGLLAPRISKIWSFRALGARPDFREAISAHRAASQYKS